VEEEVRTTEIEIQVRTIELEMGTKPLVVVHVEIIEIVIKETNV